MPEAPAPGLGAIILAAGGSSRMGVAKQLLAVDGQPMVARAAAAALAAGAHPVAVVVGKDAEAVLAAVGGSSIIAVRNHDWATGLASSVRAGLSAVMAASPGIGAVLLAPCDQPGLTAAAIKRLANEHYSTGLIAAARYAGHNGAPAVFGREHFPKLLSLKGDEGARALLNSNPAQVSPVEMGDLAVDFDFPGDHADWVRRPP